MKGRGLYNVGLSVFIQNTYNDLLSCDTAWEKCFRRKQNHRHNIQENMEKWSWV